MLIKVLFCGGTIESIEDDNKRVLQDSTRQDIVKIFKMSNSNVSFEYKSLMSKMSEDMTMHDFVLISKDIVNSEADAFIVFHGTDCIETSLNIINLLTSKPVVIMGSYFPFSIKNNTLEKNINGAISFLKSNDLKNETYVLIDGNLHASGNIKLEDDNLRSIKGICDGSVFENGRSVWFNTLSRNKNKVTLTLPFPVKLYNVFIVDGTVNNKETDWNIIFSEFDRIIFTTSHSSTLSPVFSDLLLKTSEKNKFFISADVKSNKYSSVNVLKNKLLTIVPKYNLNKIFCLLSLLDLEKNKASEYL